MLRQAADDSRHADLEIEKQALAPQIQVRVDYAAKRSAVQRA